MYIFQIDQPFVSAKIDETDFFFRYIFNSKLYVQI
jgi:hypothetical protein